MRLVKASGKMCDKCCWCARKCPIEMDSEIFNRHFERNTVSSDRWPLNLFLDLTRTFILLHCLCDQMVETACIWHWGHFLQSLMNPCVSHSDDGISMYLCQIKQHINSLEVFRVKWCGDPVHGCWQRVSTDTVQTVEGRLSQHIILKFTQHGYFPCAVWPFLSRNFSI